MEKNSGQIMIFRSFYSRHAVLMRIFLRMQPIKFFRINLLHLNSVISTILTVAAVFHITAPIHQSFSKSTTRTVLKLYLDINQ